MTKEEINEFSVRISQSSKTQLVAITCEIVVNYVSTAKSALSENDKEKFIFNIKKAMDFVDDLSTSLNMEYSISYSLLSLYLYVKRTLISANARIDGEKLDSVINVMKQLKEAFENVSAHTADDEKSMENSDRIYTGYTYGKNSRLNEYVVRNV